MEARPLADWHEDDGPVLWWRFPVDEPPYSGTPLDQDWPGYHTHWTKIDVPEKPGACAGGVAATWCPLHGDCTCKLERWERGDYEVECPLHGERSLHARRDYVEG